MLIKFPLFSLSPVSPVSRGVHLLSPVVLLLSLMTTCQEPIDKPAGPDTTSHYFNWTIDTIGVPWTILYDVAVINENDIWAVGEIRTNEPDTVHHNPWTNYNAAHWDGTQWKLFRLLFYNFCSAPENGTYPYSTRAVYAFNDSQVVVSGDVQITILKGDVQQQIMCSPVVINAIWGLSIDNFWIAGRDGKIAHYDGTDFTIQFTGSNKPILDLFGQDSDHIWAVTGWNHPPAGSYLAEYTNSAWQIVYEVAGIGDSLGYWYYGCAIGDTLYFSSYGGIIKRSIQTGQVDLVPTAVIEDEPWKLYGIKGTSPNDLIIQAADGTFRHWNGKSWQVVLDLKTYSTDHNYQMGDFTITKDYVVGVGQLNGKGFVARALR